MNTASVIGNCHMRLKISQSRRLRLRDSGSTRPPPSPLLLLRSPSRNRRSVGGLSHSSGGFPRPFRRRRSIDPLGGAKPIVFAIHSTTIHFSIRAVSPRSGFSIGTYAPIEQIYAKLFTAPESGINIYSACAAEAPRFVATCEKTLVLSIWGLNR